MSRKQLFSLLFAPLTFKPRSLWYSTEQYLRRSSLAQHCVCCYVYPRVSGCHFDAPSSMRRATCSHFFRCFFIAMIRSAASFPTTQLRRARKTLEDHQYRRGSHELLNLTWWRCKQVAQNMALCRARSEKRCYTSRNSWHMSSSGADVIT